MKSLLILMTLASFASITAEAQTVSAPKYPVTRKVDQVDTYFGTQVADPYRWLENSDSADVHAWVEAENAVTERYLSQIPYREKLRARVAELVKYPRISAPHKVGEYYFFFKNSGLQNQSVLYRQLGLHGTPEIFLDPNTLSADGTTALDDVEYSLDDRYVTIMLSHSGSDWKEIFVREVATGKQLSDHIEWVRYSTPAWFGHGFFYSAYDAPTSNTYTASNEFQKVYYHKLGDPQSADQLVYQDPTNAQRTYGLAATEDERNLLLYLNEGGKIGSQILWHDAKADASTPFTPIIGEFGHNAYVVESVGEKLIMVTDEDAPTFRVVLVDPRKPGSANYTTIIPAKAETIQEVSYVGGKLIVLYMKDASNHAYVYDIHGKLETEIQFAGIGSASGFGGRKNDTKVFYTFSSFTTPPSIFEYDVAANTSTLFNRPELPFSVDDFVTEQVFYTSKDGTRVPMFLVHRKDLKRDGMNPTKLYAYGGFNISLTPHFSSTLIAFLEQGGILAQPNLRGGGEYGKEWHEAGMKQRKQNVFDDFIAAAEYLFKEKYTSPQRLAIAGGSNGGLLVGAVMCQRPDLCAVALPAVGVMDMLRYHKFTIGWGWASEYGTSDSAADFHNLIGYSPLHNIKSGVHYPATLVSTADHDDRVVPAHSFKFIATLQEKQSGPAPTLITIETKAGHGAGKPLAKVINEVADELTFLFYNMGWKVK